MTIIEIIIAFTTCLHRQLFLFYAYWLDFTIELVLACVLCDNNAVII